MYVFLFPSVSGFVTRAIWLGNKLAVLVNNPGTDIGFNELASSLSTSIFTRPFACVVIELSAGKIWSGPITIANEEKIINIFTHDYFTTKMLQILTVETDFGTSHIISILFCYFLLKYIKLLISYILRAYVNKIIHLRSLFQIIIKQNTFSFSFQRLSFIFPYP